MKVILLAGGYGTRLAEETKKVPKPMVKIGSMPIIIHIMNIYSYYGHKDFIICGGYKYEEIIKFFKFFSDFKQIKRKKDHFSFFSKKKGWEVQIIFTGYKTQTGGRLLKLKRMLKHEKNFFLTYGDGLADINIDKLLKHHLKNKLAVTVTAVQPPGRFGVLKLNKNRVKKFEEKVDTKGSWINGGFFIFSNKIFTYMTKFTESLEQDGLIKVVKKNQMTAYKHYNFWSAMDTLRDKIKLNNLWKKNEAPWKIKKKT